MSTTYQAISFFGQKLDENKLVTIQEERLCHCIQVTINSPKYCPECGCIWSREVKVCKIDEDTVPKGFDLRRFDHEYYLIYKDSLYEIEIETGTDMIELSYIEPAQKAIQEYLEPLELWNLQYFGLWSTIAYY